MDDEQDPQYELVAAEVEPPRRMIINRQALCIIMCVAFMVVFAIEYVLISRLVFK